jgi:hypothetical protein
LGPSVCSGSGSAGKASEYTLTGGRSVLDSPP